MLPSWQLALNELSSRRGRTALLLGTVALATSLIVAVSCSLASVEASLEQSLKRFLGGADARLLHPGGGWFDEALLARIDAWPEVELAAGRLGVSLSLIREGDEAPAFGPLVAGAVGIDLVKEPRIRRADVRTGRHPEADDEILIDSISAEKLGAAVGDVLIARGAGPPQRLTVCGVTGRRVLGILQQPVVRLDRGTVAALTERRGRLTSVYLILRDGVDVSDFCSRRQEELPPYLALEPAEMVRTGFDQRLRASRISLLIASVLTFIGAGFIVVIGLTTGITERRREMAVLRAIGAHRRQLLSAQLAVGAMLGAAGAAVGVPLGVALTALLVRLYDEYLAAGLAVNALGLGLGVAGALGAGVGGAALPAVIAGRTPPLRTFAIAARPPSATSVLLCLVGAVLAIGTHVALQLIPDIDTRIWLVVTIGLPAVLVGYFLLAVPVLICLAKLGAGPVARWLRLPPDMLRGTLLATPLRNGLTAGALMIGVALLVDARTSGVMIIDDWLGRIRFSDGFAYRLSGISPEDQAAIAALPFVTGTCPIGYLPVRLVDQQIFGLTGLTPRTVVCVGFAPERFFAMNELEWVRGDPETAIERLLDGSGVIVAERFLNTGRIAPGDRITLGLGRTKREFEIVGVVGSAGLDIVTQVFGIHSAYLEYAVSSVFVSDAIVRDVFGKPDANMLQINLAGEVTDDEAARAVAVAAPGTTFVSGRWITKTVLEIATAVLRVQTTIAFAALGLASLAMGNVIAASVRARRFEFGVLRAVGGGRGTVLRLILAETTFLAVTGGMVGVLFGEHITWMDAQNLRELAGLPTRVTFPFVHALGGILALVLMSALAALPAALSIVRRDPATLVALGRNE